MITKVVACVFVWLLLISSAQAACPTPPGGTNCLIGTPSVPTNAALKALTGTMPAYVYRTGYTSAGDGGDALYYWSASATCVDDGGSCIAPTTGTGRWLLRNNISSVGTPAGAVSIKVFGAICDAVADDTIPIRNALAAQTSAFIPANTTCRIYLNSNADGIPLHSGYHFYGENTGTSVLQVVVNNTSTFPSFDFVASGKLSSVTVEQIPPPQPYGETGEYSWYAYNDTSGNGSTVGNTTYYIKVAAVDAAGVSQASRLEHYLNPAGSTNAIGIQMPLSVIGDGTGFNVYASTTSGGTFFRQNASVVPNGSNFTFGTAANPLRTTTVNGPSASSTNTTAVSVGDVDTYWSHQMQRGASVAISGATPAGLNNTYTVQRITFPDHFIIQTSGVAAGTYTPPTNFPSTAHLTGPSGIGTTVFYAYNRDSATTGGAGKELINVELDHFTLYDASTNISLVLFDASATYNARYHDLYVLGPVPTSGVVAFRCADASPFNNHINGACFFYHVYNIVVSAQTGIHQSVNNFPAPAGPGPNAGAGMFDNWQGGILVGLDTTSVGGNAENGGGKFLQGYLSGTGPNDGTSYERYPGVLFGSHFELWSCEGCGNHGDPLIDYGLAGGAQFDMYNSVVNLFGTIPPFVLSGSIPAIANLPPCNPNIGGQFAYNVISDAPSTATPYTPVTTSCGGTSCVTRPVFCDAIGPNWTYH